MIPGKPLSQTRKDYVMTYVTIMTGERKVLGKELHEIVDETMGAKSRHHVYLCMCDLQDWLMNRRERNETK